MVYNPNQTFFIMSVRLATLSKKNQTNNEIPVIGIQFERLSLIGGRSKNSINTKKLEQKMRKYLNKIQLHKGNDNPDRVKHYEKKYDAAVKATVNKLFDGTAPAAPPATTTVGGGAPANTAADPSDSSDDSDEDDNVKEESIAEMTAGSPVQPTYTFKFIDGSIATTTLEHQYNSGDKITLKFRKFGGTKSRPIFYKWHPDGEYELKKIGPSSWSIKNDDGWTLELKPTTEQEDNTNSAFHLHIRGALNQHTRGERVDQGSRTGGGASN
jgi:hypothetical protein